MGVGDSAGIAVGVALGDSVGIAVGVVVSSCKRMALVNCASCVNGWILYFGGS